MKRLRDLDESDADSVQAQALARSFTPLPEGMIPAARAEARPRRRGWVLRPAFALLLLVLAGIASAMAWRARRPSTPPAAPLAPTTKPAPHATAPVVVPAPIVATDPIVGPDPPHTTERAPRPHVGDPHPASKRSEEETTAPRRADDFALLVDATAALRSEHAPLRALTLARQYLASHPDGALAEEALALACEAAQAAADPAAAELAVTYLERYPTGRFAARVRAIDPAKR